MTPRIDVSSMGFVDASIDNHFETVTIIYIKSFKLNLQNICGMFKLAGPLSAVHPAASLPVISLLRSKRSRTAIQLACLDGDVALHTLVEVLPTVGGWSCGSYIGCLGMERDRWRTAAFTLAAWSQSRLRRAATDTLAVW